ncbi:MAG TPA: CU044_2847 family protein [Methanospirillum sp.]|nr:CU044_2847 family protein [Methanospirillum sp.]
MTQDKDVKIGIWTYPDIEESVQQEGVATRTITLLNAKQIAQDLNQITQEFLAAFSEPNKMDLGYKVDAIELSVNISASGTIVIAEGSVEAGITVTIKPKS